MQNVSSLSVEAVKCQHPLAYFLECESKIDLRNIIWCLHQTVFSDFGLECHNFDFGTS